MYLDSITVAYGLYTRMLGQRHDEAIDNIVCKFKQDKSIRLLAELYAKHFNWHNCDKNIYWRIISKAWCNDALKDIWSFVHRAVVLDEFNAQPVRYQHDLIVEYVVDTVNKAYLDSWLDIKDTDKSKFYNLMLAAIVFRNNVCAPAVRDIAAYYGKYFAEQGLFDAQDQGFCIFLHMIDLFDDQGAYEFGVGDDLGWILPTQLTKNEREYLLQLVKERMHSSSMQQYILHKIEDVFNL